MSLTLTGINSFYGDAHILHNLDLSVREGEVLALLGRNGAGKTTTLRTIAGLLRPRSGRVRYAGRDITGLAPHRVARHGIAYVPEDRRVFPELTVRENLDVGRRPARDAGAVEHWDEDRVFALFPPLAELAGRRAGNLSGGEQQMLAVARALMGNPRLILLDEPSEGLAPVIVDRLAAALLDLKRQGITMVLSEQNLPFARRISDRLALIDKGEIVFTGAFADLDADAELRHRHLGF